MIPMASTPPYIKLASLFADLSGLSGLPGDGAQRGQFIASADLLAGSLRELGGRLFGASRDARHALEQGVAEVNALLAELAQVNQSVRRFGRATQPPSDLLDRQDRIASEVSSWIDVEALRRAALGLLAWPLLGCPNQVISSSSGNNTVTEGSCISW